MAAPVDVLEAVAAATGRRPLRATPLAGAGNNVVAKVETEDGPLAAKVYFSHPGDPRDRLGAEHGMLSFLWRNGVRCVPRPLGIHRAQNLGLYEFVSGERPSAGGIGWGEAEQLSDFLGLLWDLRDRPGARDLPPASEASFTLRRYMENLEKRLGRLSEAVRGAGAAEEFTAGRLAAVHGALRRFAEERASAGAVSLDRELPPEERTLSPADHGFHNALRRDGRLVFLDFEYAGWDDPAQVIANACLQPSVPLPAALRERFVRRTADRLGGGRETLRRLRVLYPMLAYKWALIMMNEFLTVDGARRDFAGADAGPRRASQLEKARAQLGVAEEALAEDFFLARAVGDGRGRGAREAIQEDDVTQIDFIQEMNKGTKRDYVARVTEFPKAEAARVAMQYGKDYWDGDRKFGYGGYKYDGRWLPLAKRLAEHYGLKPGDKILDVGCGKGFLLHEFTRAVPGVQVAGLDVSAYGVENAKEEVKPFLKVGGADKLPYPDKTFDFVYSNCTLHNLHVGALHDAVREIERVGRKNKYICVESYRNEEEKANLLYWQLTCASFYSPGDWAWFYKHCGYTGDYGFIYFE